MNYHAVPHAPASRVYPSASQPKGSEEASCCGIQPSSQLSWTCFARCFVPSLRYGSPHRERLLEEPQEPGPILPIHQAVVEHTQDLWSARITTTCQRTGMRSRAAVVGWRHFLHIWSLLQAFVLTWLRLSHSTEHQPCCVPVHAIKAP